MNREENSGNELDIENDEVMDWKHNETETYSHTQPLLFKRVKTTSQIAIVGSNICPIESLDYEILENEFFKQDWRSRKKVQIFQYVILKWAFALLIGLLTGLFGIFNNIAVENLSGFKLLMTTNLMTQHKYFKAFAVFAGCNVVFAAAAATLCAFISPAAAGSGIPKVKAYLNGVDAYSILAPGTLFVKIFGSVLGVSAGFVVGKEGPMVHTGACIVDRRDLITCGAAAGVAAAFRAPVGGVLFALEEAASWWRSTLLWRTFFTTAVVAIVLRAFIQICSTGRCGLFGEGGLIMYDVSAAAVMYSGADILAVILLGTIRGIFGSLYNYLVDKVLRVYSILNRKGAAFKVLLVIIISLLTSCCAYGLSWFATCIPCPTHESISCPNTDESGNNKSFQCPPGYYNDLASLFLNTNDDAIRNLMSTSTVKEFHIHTLIIFFAAVFCLGIITYGIAFPTGLFIPVILAGACYGRLVGRLFETISKLDAGLFALLGAASFLGGTMRMTVSLCDILLELTNDLLLLPLVMLVLLISKSVADIFNKGVYDQIVKLNGFPYLEAHAEPYMRQLVALDVVSGPLITFSGIEKVGNILHALRTTGHNGFPVIDDPPLSDAPELCGIVLRSHLLVLLKGKAFSKDRIFAGEEIFHRFAVFDFAKAGSGKGIKVEDLDIEEEEMDMYIDLHPITNTSPYMVVETMSLAKVALLFRQLGLRHMCVIPKSQGRPPVVGILTRHDFMPVHILGLYPHMKPHK
ncbi:hypothetical protein EZV62_015279 [Acer yangbiense]|uniref:Chloride channel protein n=1 Tax=Acer yangbiense TaxID=1000413 RepID=A0A5C7HWK5_9ROSI|nr:hypothetical protein EZV62_015279 [Acer yangbiense]